MASETILAVDDDVMALDLCCSVLTHAGYRVLRAASGAEALELYRRSAQRIDMALVDVVMPGMNGIELVKRLQTLKRSPKVALISGYSPDEVDRLVGKDGVGYRIFWKPYEVPVFLQMIRNVLDSPLQASAAGVSRP